MQLSDLLTHPSIHDVISTPETLYLITTTEQTPAVYSDKRVVNVPRDELLAHEELPQILTGESLRNGPLGGALRAALLYEYDLKGLKNTQKQRFSHQLYGTGGRTAHLNKLQGERVGRAAFLIPKDHQQAAEQFLTDHGVQYRAKEILVRGEQA